MIYKNEKPAIFMFEDGRYFEGIGFGATKKVFGECTFTTIPGSGYVETLTDPALKDQIIVFTYTSIGNYGVPAKQRDQYGILKQFESESIQLKGMVVNEYCKMPSHYESVRTLEDWLIEEGIPGIQWVDTRMITQEFVKEENKLGLLQVLDIGEKPNIKELKNEVLKIEDPVNKNLIKSVSTKSEIIYCPENFKGTVIILDLGVKNNILRTLLSKGIRVIIMPYDLKYEKIEELKPDGILISNGPGNPNVYKDLIKIVRDIIKNDIPILGIGLGNVILGLAAGMDCYKLTAEHRGGRTSVESATNHCYITFQNHAYCLKNFQKDGFRAYFHDKDDNTNEGIIHDNKPFFSVAFNPEASPGALDMKDRIFNKFLENMGVL
jgi:carbamoyl-phosphate synthase small subunit